MKNFLCLLLMAAVIVLAMVVILSILSGSATAQTRADGTPYTVLDHLNFERMSMGLYPLLPDANLQATAAESVRRQAAGGGGHRGTLQTSSAEGTGSGRIGEGGFRFSACYHRPGDYTTKHRWAGAAIYKGRTCLSLDNDQQRGAIGSAPNGGSSRGGILKRIFGRRR